MKKIFLAFVISTVLLTSCSKALYKDKYDWVKVDRHETVAIVDSAKNTLSTWNENSTAKQEQTTESTFMSDEEIAIAPILPADTSGKQKKERKEQEEQKALKTHKVRAIEQKPVNISISRTPGHKSSNLSTEDKGYILGGIAVVVLLIVMAAVGPEIIIPWLLLGINIFLAIMAIVAIVLMIYGIIWIFGQFIFMMDH